MMAPPSKRGGSSRSSPPPLVIAVALLVGGAIWYQVRNPPRNMAHTDDDGPQHLQHHHPQLGKRHSSDSQLEGSAVCSGTTKEEQDITEKELSRLRSENEWLHKEYDHLREQYSAMEERLRLLEEDAKESSEGAKDEEHAAAREHVPDAGAAASRSSGTKAAAVKVSVDAAGAAAAGDWHHEIAHTEPVVAIEDHQAVEQEAVEEEEEALEPQAEAQQEAAAEAASLKQASVRLQAMRKRAPELLTGMNPFIYMEAGTARTVFATPANYYFTHAGPKKQHYEEKTLPEGLAQLLSATGTVEKRHKSCAIVGNGRQLLSAKLGEKIDQHDAVMRFNQGPYRHYEPYVGSKTTYRIINHKWAEAYLVNTYLQLEKGVTLVVSRTEWQGFLKVAKRMKGHRSDVVMRLLTRESADAAGNLLRELKSRLEAMNKMRYPGKASPSSGWVGLHFMLQVCDSVTTYGVGNGPQPKNPQNAAWHYFENRHFKDSREFGAHPHHSFDLEHDALQILDAGGIVKHIRVESNARLEKQIGDSVSLFHGAIDEDKPRRAPRPGELTVNDGR